MPVLILSTGIRLLSEQVKRAEFYVCRSLRSSTSIDGALAGPNQDFLYIGTTNSATYVCGNGAADDVAALERVGVHVNRHDNASASHG
jgi:hypothetical protein